MKLEVGDKLPEFTLMDKHGNVFKSGSVIGKKPAVIYFYPKNFTSGCKKEACDFRDGYGTFQKLGAEVIGISSDSVKSHKKFSKSNDLPFILLSDPEEKLRKKFGIKKHLLGIIPGRETLVVDKDGVLRFKFHQLKASQHMQKALGIIKQLQDEK